MPIKFALKIVRLKVYGIQTWHDGRLMPWYKGRRMHSILYAHFDDLDLDARSQWLGSVKLQLKFSQHESKQ